MDNGQNAGWKSDGSESTAPINKSINRENEYLQKRRTIHHSLGGLIYGVFFGWFGFIVGKILGDQIALLSVGFSAFGAVLFLALTVARDKELQQEVPLIRHVRSLPGFSGRYNRHSIKLLVLFGGLFALIAIGVPVVANLNPHSDVSRFMERNLVYFVFCGFVSLGLLFFFDRKKLYRVNCPVCHLCLKVRPFRPRTPHTYSGLCKQCGILWDLDIETKSSD